jgi:menaquinone-dependent protoporphyrinogen IX oxidase
MIGILYASKYGFTKKIVTLIQKQCKQPSILVNLEDTTQEVKSVLEYIDKAVVGGPIYNGEIHHSVTQFLAEYKEDLLQKEIVLFISGLQSKDTIQIQMDQNFPLAVLDHATIVSCLGGGINFENLSWLDKVITKKSLKIENSMESIQQDKLDEIIEWCNQ